MVSLCSGMTSHARSDGQRLRQSSRPTAPSLGSFRVRGQRRTAPTRPLRFWLDFYAPWESLYTEVERLIPVGDKVVALVRQYGRMAGSRREVESLLAAVYYVRSGRIARAEFYTDRADALRAAGLRE